MKTFFHLLKIVIAACLVLPVITVPAQEQNPSKKERLQLAGEMDKSIRTELLNKWYPQSVDSLYGGFLSTFSYNFTPTGPQDKMIVSQARHVWSNAVASQIYPESAYYKSSARQGFLFLQNVMWDKVNGGFFTLVDRKGNVKDSTQKVSYGNAFGIYASARWYMASGDTTALNLAKKCFWWLEKHAHDPVLERLLPASAAGWYTHKKESGYTFYI